MPQKSQVKRDSGMGWRLFFGLGDSRTGLGSQAGGKEVSPRPDCWWAWLAGGKRGAPQFPGQRQLGGRFPSEEPRQQGSGFSQPGRKGCCGASGAFSQWCCSLGPGNLDFWDPHTLRCLCFFQGCEFYIYKYTLLFSQKIKIIKETY